MYQCNTDSRDLIAAFPQLLRTGERLCCSLTTTGRGLTERWLSPTPPSYVQLQFIFIVCSSQHDLAPAQQGHTHHDFT